MRCPAAPVKVNFAFWPGADMFADAGGPPGVIIPPASGGTSYSRKAAGPPAAPAGPPTIASAPEPGSARTPRKAAPPAPKKVLPPTGLPSGPTIEAVAEENDTELIVALTR